MKIEIYNTHIHNTHTQKQPESKASGPVTMEKMRAERLGEGCADQSSPLGTLSAMCTLPRKLTFSTHGQRSGLWSWPMLFC